MRYIIILMAIPCLAFGWSDPILITPDTSASGYSRLVFDGDGNLHFFFNSNRGYYRPYGWRDLYHCKFTPEGYRLTEDRRLDTLHTIGDLYPSPVYGSDGKLHVVWDEIVSGTPELNGIYYTRLDTDGNIERQATRIFECSSPRMPWLFEDSEGSFNVVWLSLDNLYYGKFDSSGQVLIPQTLVYMYPGYNLSNLKACIDNLDQIHCTYRHYWGLWDEWNMGYSRVNNQGEVLIEYAPLTPQITGIVCGWGTIVADDDNNLHLAYLYDEYGTALNMYRKMDPELNTIYDIVLEHTPMSGSGIGYNEIGYSYQGYVVLIMVHNYPGIDLELRSYYYSTMGIALSEPETVYSSEFQLNYPDIFITEGDFWALTCTGAMPHPAENGVLYFYKDLQLGISTPSLDVYIPFPQLSIGPNPANPVTWISFSLPAPQEATLAVYNILGAKVTTLVSGLQMPGTHNVIWNAAQYSSGVYIIRLETPQNTFSQRVMVVK